jgi:general secretion pathway protein D
MNKVTGMNPKEEMTEPRWLEISANLACWIGIAGLIALIAQGAWAAPLRSKAGFSSQPFNPYANSAPAAGAAPGRNGFMDEDDDDDDDFDGATPSQHGAPLHHSPSAAAVPSHQTYSAGGSPNTGPDPVYGAGGISVGGAQANGVISSKNKVVSAKVDDETAEGSKDIVTDFNFPDADILDIAKTLGKLTGKNFILDKDVKGRITIISNSPITVGEAWKVFLTALDINGFALIPSGKYLRIARQRDARDKQLKTYTGDFSPDTDALISRVFPLKYITAEEVARTFRSFMPANSRIIPYEQTNTVIVTDTGSNIAKLAKMLEILDVEGYDAGIEVVPVKFASAAELSKLIDALIPGTSTGAPGSPGGVPRFGGGGGRFNSRRTKEGGIINTIIADERTNTLIVHANTRGADQVRELVAKLDQRLPMSTGGGKVHVVYLQFADAEQMANTLNNFSAQTPGRPTGGGAAGAGGTGTNPNAASLFEGTIKISPDKSTNALVITAAPSDFVTVQRVINRLDIPRDQVYIEVVIMEVGLNRDFNFSANIVSAPSLLGSITKASDIASIIPPGNPFGAAGAILGFAAGNQYTLNVGGQSVQVSSVMGLIKAIQTTTNTNVLATPQISALDNSEANFESAEKIPYLTSTAVQGAGVSNSIQKESVAVSIKIKPQINKMSNFVKLDVTAKLGDIETRALPSAVQDQAYATLDRTTQTTVVVGDADTVVLGGLVRDKTSDTISKIPLLGDIPLLGWLFKSKTTTVAKSNLLIFMTPHIIRQYAKVRAILDRKLKERDDFIEGSAGGEDPLREHRDAIIRSLPDIKDIEQKKPATTVTIDEDRPAAVPVGPGTGPENGLPGVQQQAPFNPEDRVPAPGVNQSPGGTGLVNPNSTEVGVPPDANGNNPGMAR